MVKLHQARCISTALLPVHRCYTSARRLSTGKLPDVRSPELENMFIHLAGFLSSYDMLFLDGIRKIYL